MAVDINNEFIRRLWIMYETIANQHNPKTILMLELNIMIDNLLETMQIVWY